MRSHTIIRRALTAIFGAAYAALPAFGAPASLPPRTSSPSGLNLDLSSSQASIAASATLAGTTIHLGSGHNALSVTSGQLLTPAEYLAALQILNSGKQTLILGANGSAVGGSFRLTSTLGSLGELVIPKNVTALDYFAGRAALSVASSFNDSGALLGIGQSGSSLNITAGNVSVFPTGSISTFSARTNGPVNLSIYSAGNIENAGSITSTGRLQLSAADSVTNESGATISGTNQVTVSSGNGQITNNGTISSQTGNLLLSTTAESGLIVNNESGVLEAANHAVIFDAGNGGESIQLTGGDVTGESIDFNGRSSDLQVDADSLHGVVNIDTNSAHVSTGSAFDLGKLKVSGDPTFLSSSTFTFHTNFTVPAGQALTVLAQGSIVAAKGVTKINSTGGALTLVSSVTSSSIGGTDSITGIQSGGASIDLSGVNLTSSTSKSNGFGGVVLLVSPGGDIRIGNINSSAPAGTAGSVTLQAPLMITTGSITAVGKNGGGAVTLNTGPVSLTGPAQYDDTSGIPQQTTDPFSSGAVAGGSIFVGGGINSSSKGGPGGAVTIDTANRIRVDGNINSSGAAGGKLPSTFPHTGGTVSLSSSHDAITVLGSINASGQQDAAISINLTADTGLDVLKDVIATGAIHAGSVNINVNHIGDIRLGVNAVDPSTPSSDPLVLSKSGGVNVSSTQGFPGNVEIEAHSGTVYIGKSVNASGSNAGGTIGITGLEHLLIGGTITANANDGPGGHIQITATGFSTPNLLFGMDTGAVSATGKLAGGVILLDAENLPMLVRGGLNVSSSQGAGGDIQTNSLLDTTIQGSVLATGPHSSGATGVSLNAGLNGGLVSNGGILTVLGAINTSSSQGEGGFVGLVGQTGITVGAITTTGLKGGGQVTADSGDGILTVNGNINTSSLNFLGAAFNAGNVFLNTNSALTSFTGAASIVNGNIIARGGSSSGVNASFGGGGGTVYIGTAFNALPIGPVQVGSIDTQGGNTTDTSGASTGGPGGQVVIFGNTLRLLNTAAGGASVNATGGVDHEPTPAHENGGAISVVTDGQQPIPSNLNLSSTKATEFALPGALFVIGNSQVNGSRGSFVTNTGSTINQQKNQSIIGTGGPTGTISIQTFVTNTTYDRGSQTGIAIGPTTVINGKTVRTPITPAEALALYQKSRNATQTFGLTNQGGAADDADNGTFPNNITIQVPAEFSKNFTTFNIATQDNSSSGTMFIGIEVNDTTPSVYIGLPKSAPSNINQPIFIHDDNATTATVPALVDIHAGSAPINVGTGGGVVTSASGAGGPAPNLRISAVGALKINDNGALQGGTDALGGPGGIKVTSGAGGNLDPLFGLEISGAEGMQTPKGGFSFLSTAAVGQTAPILQGNSLIFAKSVNIGISKPNLTLPSTQFTNIQYWDVYGPVSIKTGDTLAFGTGIPGEVDHLNALGAINIQMFASSSTTTFEGVMQINTPSSFSLFSTTDIKSPTTGSSVVQITCGTNLSMITQGALNDGNGNASWQFDALKGTMVLGSTGITNPPTAVSFTSMSDQFTSFGNMSIFAPGVINTGNSVSGPGYQCETGTLQIGSYQKLGLVNDATDVIGGFFESRNVVMNLGSTTGTTTVFPQVTGNFRIAGSIQVNFHGNNTIGVISDGAALDSRTGVAISGDDTIIIGSAEIFSTGGTVSITTPSTGGANIDIGAGALIGAGTPALGCCTPAPITKSQITSAGSLDIEAGGAITLGANSSPTNADFRTAGGDITIKSFSGTGISLGNQTFFQAFGGNIEILSQDGVQGGTTTAGGPAGNKFEATSLVNGHSITGGGVEIRSGSTTGTIAGEIAHRNQPFLNAIASNQLSVVALNSTPNNKGEVIIGSAVTLNSTSNPGTGLIISGQNPAVVVAGNVTLDSAVIGSATPISQSETEDACSDLIVDADTDDQ